MSVRNRILFVGESGYEMWWREGGDKETVHATIKAKQMEVVKAVSYKENAELPQLGFKHTVSSAALPTKLNRSSLNKTSMYSHVVYTKKRLDPAYLWRWNRNDRRFSTWYGHIPLLFPWIVVSGT